MRGLLFQVVECLVSPVLGRPGPAAQLPGLVELAAGFVELLFYLAELLLDQADSVLALAFGIGCRAGGPVRLGRRLPRLL